MTWSKMFFSVNSWGTQTSTFFVLPSRFNRCEIIWAMLKRSAISRVVRSTLIAAKIWSSSVMDGRPEQHRRDWNESAQTNADKCQHLRPSLRISRCASVAFNPFRKKNNEMCRKRKIIKCAPFYLPFLTNIAHTKHVETE